MMAEQATLSKTTLALRKLRLDELRTLARKLNVSGYSSLKKELLIEQLELVDQRRLQKQLFPSWWDKHHNHVYGIVGVLGLLVTVGAVFWTKNSQSSRDEDGNVFTSTRLVPVKESPIGFSTYASISPADRANIFEENVGKSVTWEGELTRAIGFELNSMYGLPVEEDLSIEIAPSALRNTHIRAIFQFGVPGIGDSGYELANQLTMLRIGQRLRLFGTLSGSADMPILEEAFLDAAFPLEE